MSYLPQNLVLFPHMTVAENVAFGLQARGWKREQIEARVAELLHFMHLEQLRYRHPKQLSGGERQRTALARALAPSPDILLLDEPLANIDMQTAKRIRTLVKEVHDLTGLTTVYVTHNLEEAEELGDRVGAEELGDRVGFLCDGSLRQVGKPSEVFFFPQHQSLAEFVGMPNILDCSDCRAVAHGVAEVTCAGLTILVPHEGNSIKRIAFFPSDVFLSTTRPPRPDFNRFVGVVVSVAVGRSSTRIGVAVRTTVLYAEMSLPLFNELDLSEGCQVHLILTLRRIRTYERAE